MGAPRNQISAEDDVLAIRRAGLYIQSLTDGADTWRAGCTVSIGDVVSGGSLRISDYRSRRYIDLYRGGRWLKTFVY